MFPTNTIARALATGIASCIQLLGSVIGIAIAQVILTNGLSKFITPLGLDAAMIQAIRSSVEVVKTLPNDIRPEVIEAYVRVSGAQPERYHNALMYGLHFPRHSAQSLRNVYTMAIPAGILTGLSGILIKRVNVKKMGIKMGAPA